MSVDTEMNISPVLGTNANDVIRGTGRSEVLSGAGGEDVISALSGNDEVFGGTGNDLLKGQGGDDVMYGNGKPNYIDMSSFTVEQSTTAVVTFMDEGAGYRNSLGVYEIDEDGGIFNPQILFANASKVGSGGDLLPGVSEVTFDITAGSQLGFFVISNGYGRGSENRTALEGDADTLHMIADDGSSPDVNDQSVLLVHTNGETGEETIVQSQYGTSLFHSAADAETNYSPNPDNYMHAVARATGNSGDLLIGIEDLYGGGDNDLSVVK